MRPNCVWLAKLSPENRRFVRNTLEPLAWPVRDLPSSGAAEDTTPEGGIEVLAIEAPGSSAEPIATRMPTLWLVPPSGVVPRAAGAGPHEFIRLPAPGEELTARLLSLVRAAQRERELRRSEQEAARAVERRRGMVLTLAHRVGSPLSAVIEALEMLADGTAGTISPQQREIVQLGQTSARHVGERLEEMVDAARAEAGISLEMRLAETDLRPLLQDLQDWAMPRLRGKGQRLAVQMSPRAPAVCCDRERLGQALRHLVENANRFTPPGGNVEIGVAFDPDRTGFVRITVADDGPGIELGQRERLFEPFSPPPVRDPEGAPFGIGLVLARAIASASGGSLCILEVDARGTAVALSLPAWRSRAARIAEIQARLAAPDALPGSSWVCRRCSAAGVPPGAGWTLSRGETILVSEDPPADLHRLGRVRDFREPGSLARALEPRLEFHPLGTVESVKEEA
jgi:signal transduction histidine kinase